MASPFRQHYSAGAGPRPREQSIPQGLRKDLLQYARYLRKHYCNHFKADSTLKDQVSRLLRMQLPPQRKRGRPRDPMISCGMGLLAKFRRKYPEEKPREIWKRICLILIPGYATLTELEQAALREDLQARVKSRVDLIRSRRKRQRKNRP
jgi:hypothetical protein